MYLDDERITPAGWVRAYWPEEVIELLETGNVTIVSLDHDLGDDAHGTGYDVIVWIEEAVITRNFKAPKILIHSANSSARVKMELGVDNIIKNSKP
ncbi:cyclic-phosphate processing receiver domain-containing protein [Aeromonas allosaccharophila]|uniref:cyclic-phosphate processing receiver domain-containing protein n=1 Tax=Aeromonas allosaccharophila TaxID=656 RepID=UPI002ADF9A98|nr:cyclic-phosphate processing receiver domain-containing protein [Aeromonas allosaccharophila]